MLAVVLAGIGIGALLASTVWTRFPNADSNAPVVAAASAAALVLCYSGFVAVRAEAGGPARYETLAVLVDSVRLMLPVSILSGIFFMSLSPPRWRDKLHSWKSSSAATPPRCAS